MKLPDGWDEEITPLYAKIDERDEWERALFSEMKEELWRVEQHYEDQKRPIQERVEWMTKELEAWKRIRGNYHIEHPKRKSELKTTLEAAEVLAHYWQGEELDSIELLRIALKDGGSCDSRVCRFAIGLTNLDSPERRYVEAAQHFIAMNT